MQVGISPKVYVPALAGLAVGVALLLLGLDVEGRTLIGAALGGGFLGYQSPPGDVVERVGPASDDLLEGPDGDLGTAGP